MNDAEKRITMSETELAAFVAAQIVEHEQAKQREAERIMRLQDPTPAVPTTKPLPQASPELMAEFNSILDAANGDAGKATERIAAMLGKHLNGKPIYPEFYALYTPWSGNYKSLLEIMVRRRAHDSQEAAV
jgi:hypothetical protein